MRNFIFFSALIFINAFNCFGGSIDYGAVGNAVLTPSGMLSATGNSVRVGTFAAGFNFGLNATNYVATNNAFTQYGSTVIGSGGAPAGQFFDSTIDLTGVANNVLYIWAFDSANPAAATAWAIVTNNAGNWRGPADGPGATQIDLSESGVFVPNGALGARVPTGSGNAFNIQMSAVPEPSTYVMLGLGLSALAFGTMRRRQAHGAQAS